MDEELTQAARDILHTLRTHGVQVATAESCTGGLIAAALTAIPGSSDVVDRGFVTYSNQAKTELLGVPAELIGAVGAVSESVALHMAAGALSRSRAGIAVAVTGVAGPGGGTPDKPVGLVWFGLAVRDQAARSGQRIFPGDRTQIRQATVLHAFQLMRSALTEVAT